jgi:tetratricopeptide (TPR) repeat protein
MHLLTWHGTFVCLTDQTGAMRHEALLAGETLPLLEVDLPAGAGQSTLRHADLGILQIEAAPEPGAIRLLRDGFYMCADNNTGQVVFDRPAANAWETFLPLSPQDAADLGLILRKRWIVRATRRVIPRRQIGVRDGFKLRLGPYVVDLDTSLATLATRHNGTGPVTGLSLAHAGEDVALVVAEPRSSALVNTELWPPRARRVAEILTFATHRHLHGTEPTQEDFERDVAFLQERMGAAGLEDLLEKMLEDSASQSGPEHDEQSEPVFTAGLRAVTAHIDAARTGRAKAALEALLSRFPNEASLWFRLGGMQHEAGAYGEAQRAWEKCVALEPGHGAAAFQLAQLAGYFGRHQDSIARLDALVAAAPLAPEPRVALAQRYAELDWMDRVLDTFAPIAGDLTDWKEARRRALAARFDALQDRFDVLSWKPAPLSPQDALEQARLAFSLGRLDICANLIEAWPDPVGQRADAHILQADLRLRRSGLNEAISYLETLDGPARQNQGLIVSLARLHIAAGWVEEATAALFALAQHTPRSDALRLLCMLAHSAGDQELLRFATQAWSALADRDTMASQWAITEAWFAGRLLGADDVDLTPKEPPFPTVMQFWNTAERPADVQQAMQTWQDRNPGIAHSVFDDAAARAFMAEFCADEILECYSAAHHPAMQSDIFRLAYLYVHGGVYVDADDMCTRDMRGIFAALSQVELVAVRSGETPPYVHNNFIAVRPRCAIIADALRDAVVNVLKQTRKGERPDIWQATGPGLLTRAIAKRVANVDNKGKVLLLSESEYRSFSIIQDMGYKHADEGDWRLMQTAAPAVAAAPAATTPAAPSPVPPPLDDVMTGWAMREVSSWQFRPVSHADARRFFETSNESRSWIAIFDIANNDVTVRAKPHHLAVPTLLNDRTERYRQFFRSVLPFLPPGFSTTLCMGMGDALPSSFEAPLFCFQKSAGLNALLLPDIDFLNHDFYAGQEPDRLTYHEKLSGAVFAGSTTGGLITPAVARDLSTPRLRAAKFFVDSNKVDFRLPNVAQCSTPEAEEILRAQPFCQKPALSWPEQLRRRMIISIDGNGATCSRVAIALHSNSVLLKYASDHALYYFGGLQPWVHYVPIAQDTDVEHIVDMEARDPERFARIAANGRLFAETYLSATAARRYTAALLSLYEEAFSDKAAPIKAIQKPREAPPLPPGDTSIILAHIQSRGDRTAAFGNWVGEPGSTLAIEGFALSLPAFYPAGLTYRAMMANGMLSDIGHNGEYRGTRGENLPTYGLLISLDAEFSGKYEVEYEASFIDGTLVGPVPNGTLCVAPSGKQMEAVRITLSQRKG